MKLPERVRDVTQGEWLEVRERLAAAEAQAEQSAMHVTSLRGDVARMSREMADACHELAHAEEAGRMYAERSLRFSQQADHLASQLALAMTWGAEVCASVEWLRELAVQRVRTVEAERRAERAEAERDAMRKERDVARSEAFARGNERDVARQERDALLADRHAWKEQVERNAYLGEQERAERAEAEAREAREEASRAWAALTGRDWMEGRPDGSAVAAAERVVADLAAARAALAKAEGALVAVRDAAISGGGTASAADVLAAREAGERVVRERDEAQRDWEREHERVAAREAQIEEAHAHTGCEREWTNLHDLGDCLTHTVADMAAALSAARAQLAAVVAAASDMLDGLRLYPSGGHAGWDAYREAKLRSVLARVQESYSLKRAVIHAMREKK